MFERGVGCIWIVRVICTAQRALSVLGVLVYILVFRGWTLTCHSRLLRLVLFIFSLATFCIYVYVYLFLPFSSFSFSFSFSFSSCCSLFGLIRLSPPVTHQDGWTPLHLASYNGHMDMAVLLVEKGADLNAKNEVSPHAPIC